MDALNIIGIIGVFVLCIIAYSKKVMTQPATIIALGYAVLIVLLQDYKLLLVMLIFPALAFASILMGLEEKKKKGVQEGKNGECRASNIIGVILAPVVVLLVYYLTDNQDTFLTIQFISAIQVSLSDTLASEIGVMSRKQPRMLLTWKPCEHGANGGITALGTLVSFSGSLVFGIAQYWFVFGTLDIKCLIPGIAGILGNLLDSVEGELLENRGLISNLTVNASTSLAGAVIGFLLALLV